MSPFFVCGNRSQYDYPCPFRQIHYLVRHLLNSLRENGATTLIAVQMPDACEEKPKIVIDLRDRAHCGSGIMTARFLFYGDCRRKPFYGVNIRLVHSFQKLTGIGRQRLHIPALALGIESIKRKR